MYVGPANIAVRTVLSEALDSFVLDLSAQNTQKLFHSAIKLIQLEGGFRYSIYPVDRSFDLIEFSSALAYDQSYSFVLNGELIYGNVNKYGVISTISEGEFFLVRFLERICVRSLDIYSLPSSIQDLFGCLNYLRGESCNFDFRIKQAKELATNAVAVILKQLDTLAEQRVITLALQNGLVNNGYDTVANGWVDSYKGEANYSDPITEIAYKAVGFGPQGNAYSIFKEGGFTLQPIY